MMHSESDKLFMGLAIELAYTAYENNEVPMSVMFKDLLTTYKLGWKTSYYQNTYDFKGEDVEELREEISTPLEQESPHPEKTEEECEACAI